MPTPTTQTVDDILKASPLLKDAATLNAAFPSDADRAALVALAKQLDTAIAANKKAEDIWQTVSNAKAVILKLVGMALGKPL